MKAKFLILGTLAAGLTIFAWGAFSHEVLPWHNASVTQFTYDQEELEGLRARFPENGMYASTQGVLAAVALKPDLSDPGDAMGTNLVIELVTSLLVAFLLAMILLSTRSPSVLHRAALTGMMGAAAALAVYLPHWNWWGFSMYYTGVNILDTIIAWFLAGLVLGALLKKMQVVV